MLANGAITTATSQARRNEKRTRAAQRQYRAEVVLASRNRFITCMKRANQYKQVFSDLSTNQHTIGELCDPHTIQVHAGSTGKSSAGSYTLVLTTNAELRELMRKRSSKTLNIEAGQMALG